jgi:hypothetical protein
MHDVRVRGARGTRGGCCSSRSTRMASCGRGCGACGRRTTISFDKSRRAVSSKSVLATVGHVLTSIVWKSGLRRFVKYVSEAANDVSGDSGCVRSSGAPTRPLCSRPKTAARTSTGSPVENSRSMSSNHCGCVAKRTIASGNVGGRRPRLASRHGKMRCQFSIQIRAAACSVGATCRIESVCASRA